MRRADQSVSDRLLAIRDTRVNAGQDPRDRKRRRVLQATVAAVALAGFTWYVLHVALYEGHRTFIADIAVNPDNSTLVTVDLDAKVCIWDASDLRLLRAADVPGSSGFCIHVLPEGNGILVGGIDDSVGGARLALLTRDERDGNFDVGWMQSLGTNAAIRLIASSRDGELVALGTFEYQAPKSRVILFDMGEQSVIREIQAATGISVTALALSPSADLLAYATGDIGDLAASGMLVIEPLDSTGESGTVPTPSATVTSIQFTSDGTRLLTADYGGNISVYDAADLSELRTWNVQADSIEEIALISGDRYLVVGGTKTRSLVSNSRPVSLRNLRTTGMIQVWDLENEQLLDEEILPYGVLAGIALIDDGQKVAAASVQDDEVYCVDFSEVIPAAVGRDSVSD